MNPSKFKNSSQFMPKQNFKFSSKLSTSQPELPIYTKQSNGASNCKLNIIPEISSSANEFKALNALDLRNKNFLSQVEWSEEAYSLKNIIKYSKNPCSLSSSSIPNTYENNFPILVKVVKGNYGIVKEPSTTNSSNNSIASSRTVQNLLLYGKTKSMFILCQSIKFNKEKKPYVYGKNISIPITYNGWFEILSEDGKSIKPMTSIKELYYHWANSNNFKKMFQKRKNNLSYIVRENITAYIIPPSSCFYLVNSKNSLETNSNSEKLYSSVELNECKSVIIRAGDILQIDGEIYLQSNFDSPKNAPTKKLIKCLVKRRLKLSSATAEARSDDTSKHAEVLYLPEDTQGRYSPVARIENISGVHKLADLVKKFRFPVTVQLVYGRAPPVTDTSSSLSSSDSSVSFPNSNRFTPILKLLKIYEEENIFAYPVGKESCLIQIPTHAKLSMIKSNNMSYLIENSSYLRSILNECKNLAPEYSDMINCLPKSPPQSILDGLDNLNTGIIQSCVKSLVGRAVLFENSSEVDLKEASHNSLVQKKLNSSDESNNNSCSNNLNRCSNNRKSGCFLAEGEDENKAYDEIDRLYEYVRTGVLPETYVPEKVIKTSKTEKSLKNIKKSGSLLKLCQNNGTDQPPLPIRIKITNHADQSNGSKNNNILKRQQSITHLLAANGLDKSREDLRAKTKKKETNNIITNNSNNSIDQTNDEDNTSKDIIDYYCAKTNSNQIKRSASLNKLDSFHSKTNHPKVHHHNNQNINNINNNSNPKITQIKKHIVPKLVFPIVKHTKKVNFSGVNHYQQVLPPPPVITKTGNKNIKPIELKLSDLTELANIKAIVTQNTKMTTNTNNTTTNISSEETKQSKHNFKTSTKIPFNVYNSIDNDNTYKTDYSTRQHTYNEPNSNKSNKANYNLRKNDYFDSLQTLNDYDLSSSNNIPTTNHNNKNSNNNNNLYHSFAANDLLSSGEDENFYYEENENYFMQKSQFAPFGNTKSNADMTMVCSNEKLNAISKKKVKIYARNEYASRKTNINNNIDMHGLRNYSSMEKLQIIRLQKY